MIRTKWTREKQVDERINMKTREETSEKQKNQVDKRRKKFTREKQVEKRKNAQTRGGRSKNMLTREITSRRGKVIRQEENQQTEEELVRQVDKMQAKQIDISSKTSRLEVEEDKF